MTWAKTVALGVLTMLIVAAVVALIVVVLWNWLMPELMGLKPITWFQAWGLTVLCRLLFAQNCSE